MSVPHVAVIMAGGAGERFWPASHGGRPKQLLRLLSDKTMIEDAVARIEPLIPPDRVFIALGADIEELARRELSAYTTLNLIVEPERRNTTACLALAHAQISARFGDHVCAVLTADHVIRPESRFREQVARALQLAEAGENFVLMGMRPTRPETGYGYIEEATLLGRHADGNAFAVASFKEKPDIRTAMRYLADGKHFWNSGMFFWHSRVFDGAVRSFVPEIGAHLDSLGAQSGETLRRTFGSFPSIPVDVAIMERAPNLCVLEADFHWDDIGSWTALERLHEPGTDGNVFVGPSAAHDCTSTIAFVESTNGAPPPQVALLGLKDVVVAVSDGRVLVAAKDRAQDVKAVLARLRESDT